MNRPDIIATRLRKAMSARELTRKDLAELAHCSESTIRSIQKQERGVSVALAVDIAKALNVRPAWLLDLED